MPHVHKDVSWNVDGVTLLWVLLHLHLCRYLFVFTWIFFKYLHKLLNFCLARLWNRPIAVKVISIFTQLWECFFSGLWTSMRLISLFTIVGVSSLIYVNSIKPWYNVFILTVFFSALQSSFSQSEISNSKSFCSFSYAKAIFEYLSSGSLPITLSS